MKWDLNIKMKIKIGAIRLQIKSLTNDTRAHWRTCYSKAKDNITAIKRTKRYIICIAHIWLFLCCFLLLLLLFRLKIWIKFLLISSNLIPMCLPGLVFFFIPNNTSDAGDLCQTEIIAVSSKLSNSNTSARQIKMIFFKSTKTTIMKK